MANKIPKGAATANCKRCQETAVPSYFGSPRKCAFNENGVFTSDNWNCVTAGMLRQFAGEDWDRKESETAFYLRYDDQSYAALFVPSAPDDLGDNGKYGPFRGGGFLAMTWYKHRGQTEVIIRVDPRDGGRLENGFGLPITADEAEAALQNLELAKGKLVEG